MRRARQNQTSRRTAFGRATGLLSEAPSNKVRNIFGVTRRVGRRHVVLRRAMDAKCEEHRPGNPLDLSKASDRDRGNGGYRRGAV